MTKGGTKLGALPASDITFRTSMREYSEISFNVFKADCHNINVWDKLVDFRLLWVKEWNMLYELQIDLTESSETVKAVQARSLGESELSQISLYGIEINTENDIAREDYKPTVLYCKKEDATLKEYDSLLDRISEKIPHYEIDSVDASIAGIQRTFTFDGTSIYDAFQEIAEEIQCLFIIDCKIDEDTGKISRKIRVKDLLSHCNDCDERGDFIDRCSKCGGTDITLGYGKDTAVFVSKDNLADEITYSTDCDKVKNCFRLEAGDDIMTATVANCNPNGSSYIWHFSDKMKEDMSLELRTALSNYDRKYEEYRDSKSLLSDFENYNAKVDKYNVLDKGIEQHEKIADPIEGYPQLMNAYYNVVDFRLFLESGLMPSVEMTTTTAAKEFAKLSGKTVAVQSVSLDSVTTVSSAVKQFAKTIVDNRYNVEVVDTPTKPSLSGKIWSGYIKVTNAANEKDTISGKISVTVTDNIATYTQQRIDKLLEKKVTTSDSATDVKALFQKDSNGNFSYGNETSFTAQIKKYSLSRLSAFHDACQACLDIMIEQGMADSSNGNYNTLYLPYYNRLDWLAAEIKEREEDINVVKATEEKILQKQVEVQNELDIEKCLGSALWRELMSFRREDTYSNDNYISDGLTNEELFKNAQDFILVAENEIYKSSTLQHTISSSLKNLLFMKEFEPIVDNFEVGNWIRVKIDGKVYRLRLLEYEISFDEPENISVTFSDVTETKTGVSDIESILNQASSMASSYDAVARQSRVGKEAKKMMDGWVKDGLSLTNQKIVNNADDQQVTMDSHGLLCREYLPITDEYDKKQLKIINRGLYLTDNNWETARAGIGNFVYTDPLSKKEISAYGVIADTIVGKIILSEKVGIYNSNNSVSIDKDGFVITVPPTSTSENVFKIKKTQSDGSVKNLLYVDKSGDLNIEGKVTATSGSFTGTITATSGSFTGTITANGGSIGGFTIGTGDLAGRMYCGTPTNSGSFLLCPGGASYTINSQTKTYAMMIGDKFRVTTSGELYAKDVNISGNITTSSITNGTYGEKTDGFSLTSDGVLSASGATIYGTIKASSFELLGNATLSRGDTPADDKTGFKVDSNGKLTASSAEIWGTIHAKSGKFIGEVEASKFTLTGGATISGYATTDSVTTAQTTANAAQTTANDAQTTANKAIQKGVRYQTSDGKTFFEVTANGKLTVKDGEFTGKVTANEGSFGVWKIGTGSSLYTGIKGIHTSGKISNVDYEIGLKSDFSNVKNLNYYICKKKGNDWDTLFSVSNEGNISANWIGGNELSIRGWTMGKTSAYYTNADDAKKDVVICKRTTATAGENDPAGKGKTVPYIEVGLKNASSNEDTSAFYILKRGVAYDSDKKKYVVQWTANAHISLGGTFYSKGVVLSSDKRLKKSINNIDEGYVNFFESLKPVSYEFINDSENKIHIGFIAQDILSSQQLINSSDDNSRYNFVLQENGAEVENGLDGYKLWLNYNEFIALNTYMIQLEQNKNKIRDSEINNLKLEISQLKQKLSKLISE